MNLQHQYSVPARSTSKPEGGIATFWLVMIILGLAALFGVTIWAGFTNRNPLIEQPSRKTVREIDDATTYKVIYLGEKWLYCIAGYEGQAQVINSCDYSRFYRDHPKLGNKPS